jgi:hypothetical protein
MSDKTSTKSSQPKPAKKSNTSATNLKAKKTKPVPKRARTDTSAPSVAQSVTDIVLVDDDNDGDIAHDSDEDLEPERDPEAILGKYNLVFLRFRHLPDCSASLQKTWRSAIYHFYNPNVSIGYEDDRLFHFFKCTARVCKAAMGGVRRYQDSKDRNSTTNLKQHAIRCFGAEAVKLCLEPAAAEAVNGSIFTAFARQGQQPVHHTHRTHTSIEARARIVKWVTENNRPVTIIDDTELRELLLAGRPQLTLPSRHTVARDIDACFEHCRDRIKTLLQDHAGRLHFATDCWTSPNHRAFVAWTVHFAFRGEMLAFLLDIVELPESHTGATLAREFQDMLTRFGLTHKILAMNADNASSNDTQTTSLANLDNSFEEENRVRCFTHSMQLSANALIQPFNAGMTPAPVLEVDDDAPDGSGGDTPSDNEEGDDDDNEDEDKDSLLALNEDDVDDGIDELEDLSETDRETLMQETQDVRVTVSKLRNLSFAIINSTTKALPAWRRCCRKLKKKALLIPRDVTTRWNSTYDMLSFCQRFRESIDTITADKATKLRKYELDDGDWAIVEDLIAILKVILP